MSDSTECYGEEKEDGHDFESSSEHEGDLDGFREGGAVGAGEIHAEADGTECAGGLKEDAVAGDIVGVTDS